MRLCHVETNRKVEIIVTHIPRYSNGQPWCMPRENGFEVSYTEGENPSCKKCQKKLAKWIPEVKRVSAFVKDNFPEIWYEADRQRMARIETEQRKQLSEGKNDR